MRVRKLLEKLGWGAQHGPYYTDFREQKPRELDVTAARTWFAKNGLRAHVTLLVECKTPRKPAAQLLAQTRNVRSADRPYVHWFGFDDPALRRAIHEVVENAGFDTKAVMEAFESAVYPRGESIVKPLLIDAPKPPCRASGTREPDRDDVDAVWNATQQLFAALHGTVEDISNDALEELRDGLTLRTSPADDTAAYAAEVLRMNASDVFLFHPVVSVESPLMLVSESGQLKEVPWCRVERSRVFGVERQWTDVVNANAFEVYASMLTSWYERVLSSK